MDELKKCPFCGADPLTRDMPDELHIWCGTRGCPMGAGWTPLPAWQNRPLEDALAAENAVLRDRLNAIHAAAEMAIMTPIGALDRLQYIFDESDLTPKAPFRGPLSPEQQQLIDLFKEADNGNP